MALIVQKFGGTSVATPERIKNVAKRVARWKAQGHDIIVVPSVAIREGVKKSFDVTAEHFQQLYGTKPRSFIYNSSQLHELERFSSDAGVQVMIINIQAFNATGKDNRRIYDELDDIETAIDEDYDGELDEDDFIEVVCPHCGETVYFDEDMIDSDDGLICPNCNETIEFEIPGGEEVED